MYRVTKLSCYSFRYKIIYNLSVKQGKLLPYRTVLCLFVMLGMQVLLPLGHVIQLVTIN